MFICRKKLLVLLAAGCVAFAWMPRAEAHLVTTGLGPVYDGMGHFLLSPDDWLPVIALALLAGLRGAEAGRRTLFGLPVAWLAGGLAAMMMPGLRAWPEQLVAAISFLVLGGLVASDFALPAAAVLALAVALGFVHGFGNGGAMREAGAAAGALELLGVAVALFVLVALAAAFVVALRQPWTRIAVRVGGSWIAAMGLLLLGWCLRKNGA